MADLQYCMYVHVSEVATLVGFWQPCRFLTSFPLYNTEGYSKKKHPGMQRSSTEKQNEPSILAELSQGWRTYTDERTENKFMAYLEAMPSCSNPSHPNRT